MYNRFAENDEDLLREQAEFLRNPRADRVVNVVPVANRSSRQNYHDQDSPFLLPAVSPIIIERKLSAEKVEPHSDEPMFSAVGQPHVPVLGEDIKDVDLLQAASRLDLDDLRGSSKPRSLFARQLLAAKKGVVLKDDITFKQPKKKMPKLSEPLQRLADTGPVVIRRQHDFAANEIVRIHETNINLLSQLSNEEIMKEREAILASADPKVISFLIHKKATSCASTLDETDEMSQSSKDTKSPAQLDASSIFSSLGVEPNPSIPHMDVVEPDKLAWMQDLPQSAKAPIEGVNSAETSSTSKPLNARFDLEGRVVPPDTDVPTHLGLHHHGDEPERGGYTVGELFHLASSSQPVQRRIALSGLAAALAASRRGYHALLLQTPSLLSSLLLTRPTGICFLLRWALDRCVSEATRASVAVGGDGGVSVALVGECLRALNNLLVDEKGEALLDEAFDWSSECHKYAVNLSPSEMTRRVHKFRLQTVSAGTTSGSQTDEGEKSDHVEAMAIDPVECLFAHTNLVVRLGWMLSPGPALRLPPDAAAHALPTLLFTAARHSTDLALLISKTPHLLASLMEHFLPLTWDDLDQVPSDDDRLFTPYNTPLPRVLKIMRILAQRSASLRLMLVNDWRLVERCFSYLLQRLPMRLPSKLGTLLQIEALRCLVVCLEEPQPPLKAIDLTKSALDKLLGAAQNVMESGKKEYCLQIAWFSFFSRFVVPRFSHCLSSGHMEQLRSWARRTAEEIRLDAYLEEKGDVGDETPPPALIVVTVHLMKSLAMKELSTLRKRIFAGPEWNRVLNHFIRYQSVLTGFPESTAHTDVLAPTFSTAYTDKASSGPLNTDIMFESGEHGDLLLPVAVSSAPPCLPDLGMSTCLLYRGACSVDADSVALPAMWWPPSVHSLYPRDVVEPLDLIAPQRAKYPSFLPLIEAAVAIENVDLTPWCSRLVRLRVPPVIDKICGRGGSLPHSLLTMEAGMMGRYLFAQRIDSQEESHWWAAFHLLPCLFFGQEDLLIELLQKVIFPINTLTPIEGNFSAEVTTAATPWPPVHESFQGALAYHAHRVYLEYFSELLRGHRPETLMIHRNLRTRPSCDFILPDDWFYMPLLEFYFLHNRQSTHEVDDGIGSTEDRVLASEDYLLKATACLSWIRGVLSRHPPPRRALQPRGLSAGEHFSRLCCAILASQSPALCFNVSGAIIAELIGLLAPRLDLNDMDQNPETYLPLDLLSLYDLFTDLLNHYSAVSYSSPIFANLLLLFLQSSALPPTYRRGLWGEHQALLRAFHLSPSEVILPTSVYEALFEPLETDEGVLRVYASALCSGLVHPDRQPLAFLIALHHLNRNIYLVTATSLHGAFMRQLAASLRFLPSRGRGRESDVEQIIDWLRRYKQPSMRCEIKSPISDLILPTYVASSVVNGGGKIANLMQFYEEGEMPATRVKRWEEFLKP